MDPLNRWNTTSIACRMATNNPTEGSMKAYRPTHHGERPPHGGVVPVSCGAGPGFRILEAGGNAIDAGVAAGIAPRRGAARIRQLRPASRRSSSIRRPEESRHPPSRGSGPVGRRPSRRIISRRNHGGKISAGRGGAPWCRRPARCLDHGRLGAFTAPRAFGEVRGKSAITPRARHGALAVYPLMSEIHHGP